MPRLGVAYVPIGQGSGACSAIAATLALGHGVRIVGVVSSHATTYADSLAAGRVVEAPVTTELADGMACRVADADALALLAPHIDHIVQLSDAEVAAAMHGMKFKGFNGDMEMRKLDHQLQQTLYVTVWQKADKKFPYSAENTGMTLALVKTFEPYVSSTPTSCQMKMP